MRRDYRQKFKIRDSKFEIIFVVVCVLLLQLGCQKPIEEPQGSDVLTEPNEGVIIPKIDKVAPRADGRAPLIKFEKAVHDFGEIGPGTRHQGEFKFMNVGDAALKISNIKGTCSCTVSALEKKEYAPGESGTVKVKFYSKSRAGPVQQQLDVYSNDKRRPKVVLTIKARIVMKIDYQPKKLSLLLKGENAGCPEITLRSVDNRPFAIRQFRSTANCITAPIDTSVRATKFVLKPEIDIQKLQRSPNGVIDISMTHPECNKITIVYNALSEFKISPPSMVVFAETQKPINRTVSILNNYKEAFEIESVSSKSGIIRVLSQVKIRNGYQFKIQITPPAAGVKRKMFTDVFIVKIKGGDELKINCRGFYRSSRAARPSRAG